MLITDEELAALLYSEEPEPEGFRPVFLYALDPVAYELTQRVVLPPYVVVRRLQPDPGWPWAEWCAAGAIALYDPGFQQLHHRGSEWTADQGIYSVEENWLEGLASCYDRWGSWLAASKVVLLEDHPYQGMVMQQTITSLGVSCQWVTEEASLLAALGSGDIRLLICDLSLSDVDAITLLLKQDDLQHDRLPIVLLSAHEQTLIDGARRLLHDAGFNTLAALAKPLDCDELLRLLRDLYLGPLYQHRVTSQRRIIRSWCGEVVGQLGWGSGADPSYPLWLAVTALPARWDTLKEWLVKQQRSPRGLTLLIQYSDNLPDHRARFALLLQARLAGCTLALLLDHEQQLPFDLLEQLPLQTLLVGQSMMPALASLVPDSLFGRFITRAQELGMAIYLDDPYQVQDAQQWQGAGMAGRW